MNKLVISLILSTIAIFTAGCSDNENENEPSVTPFSLEKNYYEIRLKNNNTDISVMNGSGDISMIIGDENILKAVYVRDNSDREKDYGQKGHINLYGLKKGRTTLTITDNVTKETENVEVKVTDCYLAYYIADSNYPGMEVGKVLFFVNNSEKECYIFVKDNIQGNLYKQPIAKGSYEFYVKPTDDTTSQLNGIPCLHLNITDNDATTASDDFQMNMQGEHATSSTALDCIQSYLDVDWEKLIDKVHTRSLPPTDMTMTLTVPDTDYQIIGVLSTASIPEHILN